MELKNKKILILGDSITEGACASKPELCFVELLKSKYNLNCINYGVGGTRIARQLNPSWPALFDYDYNMRLEVMKKDADIVIVFGGTNDFGHGDASFSGEGYYSFTGALNILFDNLKKKYPKQTIVIITPLQRSDQEKSLCGHPLVDYASLIKKEALNRNYNILDLYNDIDFKVGTEAFKNNIFTDGLHPNDNGHELIAKKIYNYLKEL